MKHTDHARIEWAVKTYDWWLDLYGTPGRRRRELRRELRTNLRDAAARSGAGAAVSALGSTKEMARAALPVDGHHARWSVGTSAAIVAIGAVLMIEFVAALAWLDGAMAADDTRVVGGSLTLFPGSSMQYAPASADAFSLTFNPGWLCLAVGVLTFVGVARPWRALTGRMSAIGTAA